MKTKSFYLFIALNILFGSLLQAQTGSLYEYFDGGKIPTGWNVWGSSSTPSHKWRGSSKQGYGGLGSLSFSLSHKNTSILRTPILTLGTSSTLNFSLQNPGGDFYVIVEEIGADNVTVENTDTLASGSWTDMWSMYEFSLNAYTGKNIRIGFVGVAIGKSAFIYLDDVVVERVSLCASPKDVELISLSQSSASLQWALDTTGNKSVPDTFMIKAFSVSDTVTVKFPNRGCFYTLAGLKSNTLYEVELYSDCSSQDKDKSKLFNNFKFKTLCDGVSLPYTEDFNDNDFLSGCWTINPKNTSGVSLSLSSEGYNGTKAMKLIPSSDLVSYVVTDMFTHPSNDMEVSFWVYPMEIGLSYSVGLTKDPLSVDGFNVLWTDTLHKKGWQEVRFCTDASYFASDENVALFFSLANGVKGNLFVDNILVRERPDCPRLEKLKALDVLSDRIKIDWIEFGKANNYEVEISGVDGQILKTEKVVTHPCWVDGLEANTEYSIRVRSGCSTDSEWSLPFVVATACDVMLNSIFTESFESSDLKLPDCWQPKQLVRGNGSGEDFGDAGVDIIDIAIQSSDLYASSSNSGYIPNGAKDGNNVLRFRTSAAGTHTALITQPIDVVSVGQYDLSFWMYRNAGFVDNEKLQVWVSNRPDTADASAVKLGVINTSFDYIPKVLEPGFYLYEYNIPLSGKVYIILEGISQNSHDIFVDELRVYPAPTCRKISGIEMDGVTENSFSMKWNVGDDESSWIVRYRLTDPVAGGATIENKEIKVDNTPEFVLSTLQHSKEYRIAGRVAAYCGVGDTSEWVEFDFKFATECMPISEFPYVEKFEGVTMPPVCWLATVENGLSRISADNENSYDGASVMLRAPGLGQALITPQYDFEPGKEYRVSFMMKRIDNTQGAGIKVLINDKQDTAGAEELLYIPTYYKHNPVELKVGYYNYKVDFVAKGKQYLMFVQTSESYSASNDYIDNVEVGIKPDCEPVVSFEVVDVKSFSAKVIVSDIGVTTCETSFCKDGISPDAGVICNSDSAVINVVNLESSTTYNVYVRNVCGEKKGDWSKEFKTITTHCVPFEITNATAFEDSFESFVDSSLLGGCYLIDKDFRITGYDLSNKYEVLNRANTGSKYVWSNNGTGYIYHPIKLKAGVAYEFSVYAVQAGTSSHISLGYGDYPTPESMNYLLFEETISDVWTKYTGYIQVQLDGDYYFGIKTYSSTNLGIDDIRIGEAGCVPPTASVENLTDSSADVVISSSDAGKWILSVNNFEFAPEDVNGNVFYQTITNPTTKLSGLSSNTTYYYSIKSLCEGEESSWSRVGTFRTRCAATVVPFTEGFENGYDCWTFMGEDYYVHESPFYKHSGNKGLQCQKARVVLPELDVESLDDYMLTGWIMSSKKTNASISVGVMTDIEDISTFVPLGAFTLNQTDKWNQFKVYFTDLLKPENEEFKNARHIVIIFPNEEIGFYIDDIEVTLAPNCKEPVEAEYVNVTDNSCMISWKSKGDERRWNIVGRIGDNVVKDTIVTTNPAVIRGLKHSTTYTFEIRSLCSDTAYSEFATIGNVQTECGAWQLPYIENFSGYSYGVLPLCWTNYVEKQSWFVEYDRLYFPNNENNVDGFKGAIVSPMFDLRGIEGANLKMKMLGNQTGKVTLKLSCDSGKTYSQLAEYDNIPATKDVLINLSSYVGKVINVCIEGTATGIENSYLIVDDFELELIESCSRPEAIELTRIGGTSVDVKLLTSLNASSWQYVIVKSGDLGVESGTIVDVTTKEFTISNLLGFSKYKLFVRANCGEKQSSWRDVEFRTICAEENSLPYVEGFEDIEKATDGCYSILRNDTITMFRPWVGLNQTFVSEGKQSLDLYTAKDNALYVVMPKFTLPTTSLKITFDYLSKSSESSSPEIRVGVMSDPTDYMTFEELEVFYPFTPNTTADGDDRFETVTVEFNVLPASEYSNSYIAIMAGPSRSDGTARIDNIKIEKGGGCPDIKTFDLDSIVDTSAFFTLGYQSSAVEVAYGKATQDIDSMQRVVVTATTLELSNLELSQNYAVYARSVCGLDTGEWTSPILFSTDCEVYTIDAINKYSENLNSYGTHSLAFPTCYTRIETVKEGNVEYPKLSQATEFEGDKNVLHLYKNVSLALPEFSLSGEFLMLSFMSYGLNNGAYYEVGLQDNLEDETTYRKVKEFYASQSLRNESVDFSQSEVTGKYIVFKGNAQMGHIYIDNIVVEKAPECFEPKDLSVVLCGDTFAVLSWKQAPAATKYEYELSSKDGIYTAEIDTTGGNFVLNNLAINTKYVLRMRTICSLPTKWVEVEFTTLSNVPKLPYICGFESAEENSKWKIVNGNQANKFIIGGNKNASVFEGDSALYIVDATRAYTYNKNNSSNVYAYRTFVFEPGVYQISYDWKCKGELGRDYGRVFLASMDTYITAGEEIGRDVLSDVYVRLHNSDKLEGSTMWTTESHIVEIDKPMNYMFVVQWSNDVSDGENPPLSIDNIRVELAECGAISALNLLSVSADAADVKIKYSSENGIFEYCLSPTVAVEDSIFSALSLVDTISLANLTENKQYYLFVRPECDTDKSSPWTMLSFVTQCQAATIPYTESFETYLPMSGLDNCWMKQSLLGGGEWLVNSESDAFANTGKNYLCLSGQAGANKNMITKSFLLEKGKYYSISVFALHEGTNSAYISIVNNEFGASQTLIKEKVNAGIYQKISVEFLAAEDKVYELGIVGDVSSLSKYLLIDDFEVLPLTVGTPTNLVVDNITENSADFSWLGYADEYEVRVMQSSVEVFKTKVAVDSITISNLQPATNYIAQVRAVSGSTYSNWQEVEFSTLCGLIYPPYFEDFETFTVSEVPFCWDNTSESNLQNQVYNWSVIKPDEYSFVGNQYGQCVQLKTTTTTGLATLLTPQIVIDSDYYLSFTCFNNSESQKLNVCVLGADFIDTVLVVENTSSAWVKERIDISKYKGKTIQIGFKSELVLSSSSEVVAVDNLRIICSAEEVEIQDAICQPSQGFDVYNKHGFKVLTSSLKPGLNVIKEVFETKDFNGCDTLKILNLTLNLPKDYMYNDTICEGEVYDKEPFVGKVLAGDYRKVLTTSLGCDSIVTLHLVVLKNKYIISETICEGDVFEFAGRELSESGIYIDTLTNSHGCDSIVTLNLSVLPKYYEQEKYICEGERVKWLDTILTTTGRYERSFKRMMACDSIVVMNLTVLKNEVETFDTICLGEYYQFVDTILEQTGTYIRKFQNMLGCDSLVTLHLHVSEPTPTIFNDYICEGELYYGYGHKNIVITQDTMLIQRISLFDRCDSLLHVYVDYVEKIEIDTLISIAAGEYYEFGNRTLSKSGVYSEVFVSSVGCDSIVNLTLQVGTDVDNVYALPLVIAPNPILGGEVTYVNRTWTAEEQRGLTLEIVNAMGQIIMVDQPQRYPIAIEGIDVRGVYIVRIISGTGDTYIGRIVVN